MFIDRNSIVINNRSMGQYLLSAKYSYPKLWANDTRKKFSRKNDSELSYGIFPKITLTFRKLTQAEMNIVAPIIDSATQSLTYYDPSLNRNVTLSTYTGDWEYTNKQIVSNKNDSSFEISFISRERRQ